MSDNATTDRPRTIADVLTVHPEGITVRALADEAAVSASTAAKALSMLETDGAATRTAGPGAGKRKGADIWRPVTGDTADAAADTSEAANTDNATVTGEPADAPAPFNADESLTAADLTAPDEASDRPEPTATGDTSPAADEATPDSAATAGTSDTPDADAPQTGTDSTTGSDAPTSPDSETTTPTDPAATAPVADTPREPDLKVLIMAGVLGGHPDGVTASDAITESGLAPATGDTILAAMEVAGAARRLPVAEDGIELWVRGDGDLAAVDPANAPTHVTCPTCGHARRVRRPSASVRRPGGPGRPTGEINTDGSQKLAKNGLRLLVEAFMRDLGPGVAVSPGTVGRELGGRSPGAVGNAMDRLSAVGILVLVNSAPVTYALTATAPAPTADVAAFMTGPVIKTDAAAAGEDTTATGNTAAA